MFRAYPSFHSVARRLDARIRSAASPFRRLTAAGAVLAAVSLLAATPLAAQFALTVLGGGSGNGTVTAPAIAGTLAMSCTITGGVTSGSCLRTYATTSTATLTATPQAGSVFTGWTGLCAAQGTTPTCAVTGLSGAQSTTASFALVCTLTVNATAGGTAAITSGGATGACGRSVTIAATPNANSVFQNWTVGGANVSTANPRTFLLTTSQTHTAVFGAAQCTLAIGTATGGSATLTTGTLTGNCGRSVTVTATAGNGYRFSGWSDGGTVTPYTLTLTQPTLTLTPAFAQQCTLTLSAVPVAGGTAAVTTGAAAGDCGRTVGVTATPSPSYTFVNWSDGQSALTRTVVVSSVAQTLTANFQEPQCQLTVTAGTGGTATITNGGATGNCGRSVTVTATPNANFSFAGFTEGGTPVSTANPWTLTLASNRTVLATFTAVPQCTLTIGTGTGGTAALTAGAATGPCGRSVTVQATAAAGYRFGTWSDGATDSPYTLVLNSSLTLTPGFIQQCTLTLAASPVAGGSAAITTGAAAGDCGRSVTATATPAAGYEFVSWSDGLTTAVRPVTVSTVSQVLTATFAQPQCTLTVAAGTGGTVTLTNGALAGVCGRNVTLTATPNTNFTFTAFTEGGTAVSTANPWTFALTANRSVLATFAAVPQCTIALATVTGGTATVTAGGASGPCGRSVTVAATAAAGFRFGGWSDGSQVTPYSFTLAQSVTLTPAFVQQCTLTLAAAPVNGGTATLASGSLAGDCGRTVRATATPNSGFNFVSWSDGATTATRDVAVTSATQALTATFAQPQCTLVLTPPTGGTTTITSGAASGVCGRSVTVQATPASGFRFAAWSDGATASPYTLVVSAPTLTLGATFTAQCVLTLTAAPVSAGTVSLTDGALSGDCGRTVTALATPNANFTFSGWSDGVRSALRPVVVSQSALSLEATFTPVPQCSVVLGASAGGTATLTSGVATGACGRSVTVGATANSGYRFTGWSDSTTVTPYTFTVTQSVTLSPLFVQQCTLVLGVTPAAGGTATLTSGALAGDCGRSVAVSATPAAGYQFTSWSDGVTTASRTKVLTPDALTLTATFSLIPQCTLTIGTATGGTAVLTSGTLAGNCGRSVTVEATAASGFRFRQWSDSTTATPYTLTLTATALTLVPDFAAQCTLVLTATPAAGGAATLSSGTLTGDCGRSVTAIATPATGYAFTGWSEASAAASYTLTVTQSTQSLSALFSLSASVRVVVSGAAGRVLRASGGTEVCALAPGQTETVCTVPLGADEPLLADPATTTGFLGWRGVCAGRGTCMAGAGEGREIKAVFTPVRSIAADVAALDLLTGTGLSLADRELLDQTGNADGVFNLGDLLAHLERTKQVLTPSISSRIMNAAAPLSQPISSTPPAARP